jgi:transcription antitermination factor NusG
VREAAGVANLLLGSDGRPAPIPAAQIERCMADDASLADLAPETKPRFAAGDRVKVVEGAFADHAGVVLQCNGAVTLVEIMMFGRPIGLHVARTWLTAAP